MNEDDVRDWLAARFPTTMLSRLERFTDLLIAASEEQNLIARSTFAQVWQRHILDSAQLAALATQTGPWVDVGSGGGLPGMVIAIIRPHPITLVEPRRRRAAFLETAAAELGLPNLTVLTDRIERVDVSAEVISARAVSSIDQLFSLTTRLVSRETTYVLPRGRSWQTELANAREKWHGEFHVEHSLTDPSAGIVVASRVRRR